MTAVTHIGVREMAEHLGTVPSNITRMWKSGGIPPTLRTARGPLWSLDDADHIKVQWDEYHRLGAFLYGSPKQQEEVK